MRNKIIGKLIRYSKIELYLWFITSMIHPSNQKFGIRYELLIHTLLAIEEDKFLNEELTKEKFEKFIDWFEKEYSSYFVMMEDFEPFQQTKLIPLFLDGKKYYFFYGSLERPYEVLKQFYDIVFSVEIEELNNIKSEFLFSLQRQTDILIELINDARLEATSMYIPTLEFFNKYKSFFEVQNIDKNYLHNSQKIPPLTEIEKMYDFGIDKETDKIDIPQLDIDDIDLDDSLYFYEMGMNNFNGLHTKIGDEYFYLPFETHAETFYSIAEHIISNNQFQSLDMLNNSMHQRMIKMLSYFFGKKQLSMGLMDNAKIVHSKYFDVISQIDKNKTILFKFIFHSDDLFNSINNVARQSFEELDSLQQVNELFAFRYLNENGIEVSQVATNISEVKIIIIFEKLTLNYMLNIDEEWKEKNIFIYNSLDIKPILELFSEKKSDTNIALWQYLNAEKLQSSYNNSFMQMDALDSFANYYPNETFSIMGEQPDMMIFGTHSWSDFYHEYLYEKYQDNIYELVEVIFPNKFKHVEHLGDNTYEYIDSSTLDGGRCIKYNNKLIWIVYPSNGFNLSKEEIRVSMFMAEFFSFYIDRYKESIFRFLKVFNFDINTQNLMIVIFPDTVVKKNENMNHLLVYANKINDNEPVFFNSYIRKVIYNEIFVGVFCSSSLESLENTFGYKEDFNPEKYVFEKFIGSLLEALNIKPPQELVPTLINNIWELKERAFMLQQRASYNNPRLEHYTQPLKYQDSFIANANQKMVEYLKEHKIEQKEYWGEEAKKLNNEIFEFLQKQLEAELGKFDSSILVYAYTQIEYIEGKREQDKNQMKFDIQKYIAFNIYERHNKERIEVSELTVSAKHILHSILKVNPRGNQVISDYDWYYLMALSKIINITIEMSDKLHYQLVEIGIEITNLYELKDIDKSSDIDFNAYYTETTNSNIISSKKKPFKLNVEKQESAERIPLFEIALNKSWKVQFGFSLDNMLMVMMHLGMYDYTKDKTTYPLSLLSIEQIQNRVTETLKEPPSFDEIEKIINFISLNFDSYRNTTYIDYTIDRLMNKKERLNLSPFIKINDKYLFGHQCTIGSFYTWYNIIIDGNSPYTIEKSLVKDELDKIHQTLDNELEELAYEKAVIAVGEIYSRKNIDKFQTLSKNFPQRPPCGEIDLLVINPDNKLIFVMDAKHVNKKFSISATNRELNKFLKGKKSYLKKLNKKFDFIRNNQDEILNHFKITDKNGWKIKKGFVVNTLYVSAFYKEKVDFVLIDDLEEYIGGD